MALSNPNAMATGARYPRRDHMDGIRDLFREFTPTNFWDTNNTK
jgi:hypothetical protein